MSESRIIIDMDIDELMDYVSMSDVVGFAYGCYEYLDECQQQEFIEMLGADEVVNRLGEDKIIEELESRGYKITKGGSEDI